MNKNNTHWKLALLSDINIKNLARPFGQRILSL
jgi:hypothetical protein